MLYQFDILLWVSHTQYLNDPIYIYITVFPRRVKTNQNKNHLQRPEPTEALAGDLRLMPASTWGNFKFCPLLLRSKVKNLRLLSFCIVSVLPFSHCEVLFTIISTFADARCTCNNTAALDSFDIIVMICRANLELCSASCGALSLLISQMDILRPGPAVSTAAVWSFAHGASGWSVFQGESKRWSYDQIKLIHCPKKKGRLSGFNQ